MLMEFIELIKYSKKSSKLLSTNILGSIYFLIKFQLKLVFSGAILGNVKTLIANKGCEKCDFFVLLRRVSLVFILNSPPLQKNFDCAIFTG